MMNKTIIKSKCPECQQPISLGPGLVVGQRTTCLDCHIDLVVTWLFPLCLDTNEAKDQLSVYPDTGFDVTNNC
jgi:hypothetical protein